MTISLYYKPYFVKVSTKGGVKNNQKNDHVVYEWSLNVNKTSYGIQLSLKAKLANMANLVHMEAGGLQS